MLFIYAVENYSSSTARYEAIFSSVSFTGKQKKIKRRQSITPASSIDSIPRRPRCSKTWFGSMLM